MLRSAGLGAGSQPCCQSIQGFIFFVNVCCTLQVNEAVNDLLIDEEDFEGLKSSIASFDNFDQVGNRSAGLALPSISVGLQCASL